MHHSTLNRFTIFAFPGRSKCKLVAPFLPGLGVQQPKYTTPSLVLYNNGEHLFQEMSRPWPGEEKTFDWLRFKEYSLGRCPNKERPDVVLVHRGHVSGIASLTIYNGVDKSISFYLPPHSSAFFVECKNTDALFVRKVPSVRLQAIVQ